MLMDCMWSKGQIVYILLLGRTILLIWNNLILSCIRVIVHFPGFSRRNVLKIIIDFHCELASCRANPSTTLALHALICIRSRSISRPFIYLFIFDQACFRSHPMHCVLVAAESWHSGGGLDKQQVGSGAHERDWGRFQHHSVCPLVPGLH